MRCCSLTQPLQVPGPIVLRVVDIGAQVLLKLGIDAFGLALRLWVVGSAEFLFDSEALAQSFPY
jgi:hypothetical protein